MCILSVTQQWGCVGNCEREQMDKQARLLVDKHYPAAWVFRVKPLRAGTVVPVVPATNQPQDGQGRHVRYWINTPELENDAYGIGLYDGEFELV